MIEEMLDHADRNLRLVLLVPFLEAAAGSGKRIVRIERQHHEFVEWLAFERSNRFRRIGVPITHGDDSARGNMGTQSLFERFSLLLRETANRRAAANFGIVLAHYLRALRGNQLCQSVARKKSAGEINNVGIAKKIVEEGFDCSQSIGASQLKKDDRDSLLAAHGDLYYASKMAWRANTEKTAADLSALRFAKLLLETLDFAAKLREAARDGNFVDEKTGPDDHPGREQKLEISHDWPFPEIDCASRLRDSTSWRNSSNSKRRRSKR